MATYRDIRELLKDAGVIWDQYGESSVDSVASFGVGGAPHLKRLVSLGDRFAWNAGVDPYNDKREKT
jgi:hypothetical protein